MTIAFLSIKTIFIFFDLQFEVATKHIITWILVNPINYLAMQTQD